MTLGVVRRYPQRPPMRHGLKRTASMRCGVREDCAEQMVEQLSLAARVDQPNSELVCLSLGEREAGVVRSWTGKRRICTGRGAVR